MISKKNQLYTVVSRDKFELVLRRSIRAHIFSLAGTLAFFSFYYYTVYNSFANSDSSSELSFVEYIKENPLHIILWGAGLFALPSIYESIKVLASKGILSFNITNDELNSYNNFKCHLSDVKHLQIRKFINRDEDGGVNDYRLSIVLANGSKVYIESTSDYRALQNLASEIADFLDVSIIVKN